jgi:hypothetical protein
VRTEGENEHNHAALAKSRRTSARGIQTTTATTTTTTVTSWLCPWRTHCFSKPGARVGGPALPGYGTSETLERGRTEGDNENHHDLQADERTQHPDDDCHNDDDDDCD